MPKAKQAESDTRPAEAGAFALKETSGRRLLKRRAGKTRHSLSTLKITPVKGLTGIQVSFQQLEFILLKTADTGRYTMGMHIATATIGSSMKTTAPELPQERAARLARLEAAQKAATLEKTETTLPGKDRSATIQAATENLEQISLAFNKRLQFVVDHESQEVIVKVIDSETDKVIKVLPPEELQRLHDRIKETIGFLFDERV
jgi:flagellar protein FlaG